MPNPFTVKVIPPTGKFCDRADELERLVQKGLSLENVTLSSPRRFGKTSLAQRAQHVLETKYGFMSVYLMLFGVTGVAELAAKFAQGVYRTLARHHSFSDKAKKFLAALGTFRPSVTFDDLGQPSITPVKSDPGLHGLALLESTMKDLGRFIAENDKKVILALDEFQEITNLKEAGVEGVLREHIQNQKACYVFIGSRRRILLDMFTDRKRPFYQSTWLMKLSSLPAERLAAYVMELFADNQKTCTTKAAELIAAKSHRYPYYAQRLAGLAFDQCPKRADSRTVAQAYHLLMEQEQDYFQANLRDLTTNEIKVLKALARSQRAPLFGKDFLAAHGLTASMVQGPKKSLILKDLIQEERDGAFSVTDPVFSDWLRSI